MFQALHLEIAERMDTTRRHFDATCIPGHSRYASTSKGLCFVQLYATWEYTVRGSVRAALVQCCAHSLSYRDVRIELTGLLLMPELESVTSSGKDKFWKRAIALLQRTGSPDCPNPPDAFPSDGSQYRLSQVYTIWELFGISEPVVPDVRLTPLVAEVVGNRNSIAHGRETADSVGRRYSKSEILEKIDGMRSICLHVASALEIQCSTADNLKRANPSSGPATH